MGTSQSSTYDFQKADHPDTIVMRLNSTSNVTDVCRSLVAAGVSADAVSCQDQINQNVWLHDTAHTRRLLQTEPFKRQFAPTLYHEPGTHVKEIHGTNADMLAAIAELQKRSDIQVTAHSPSVHLGVKRIYVSQKH